MTLLTGAPVASQRPISGRWSFPALLAAAVAVCLIAGQLLVWGNAMRVRGGPETYVRGLDFMATLTGARVVADGAGPRLYDLDTQQAAQARVVAGYVTLKPGTVLPYIHPPFEALALAPLMRLPYAAIYAIWTLGMVLAFAGALRLLAAALPLPAPARWLMLLAAGSFVPFHAALWYGQSSPLLLLGLAGAYAALRRGREGRAGAWLALLVLKPQLVPVVVLLLALERRWRTLAVAAGVAGGACVAAMPVLGVAWPLQYARFVLVDLGRLGASANVYPIIMPSLRGFAVNLLGGWAPALVTPAYAGLAALLVALFVWIWSRSRARLGQWRDDALWALACLVAVLVATHVYGHDLPVLLLPAWLVAARALSGAWGARRARGWLALLWAGYAWALNFAFVPSAGLTIVPTVLLLLAAIALLGRELAGGAGGLLGATRAATAGDADALPV
ncbi:MAG TPA: glycosyltransferase family 87 protein [Thermomicrobiales bacterium]|nr:glycosyltransferase family 87 protein [Thermomicrobiales bacterium]